MYEEFYKLRCKPFQLNPDPEFYFESKQHQRAKAYLEYGLARNEGFVVITGEVGAGKTTLIRQIFDSLDPASTLAAQVVSTQLDAEDMLRMVCSAFGILTKNHSKPDLLTTLEVFLVSQVGQGKRCLLIVDEAQNLTIQALEELRMLSNFQFGTQAILQIFLVGQPEFRNVFYEGRMQQLKQRIIAACHIGPLNTLETQQYIVHRLNISGASNVEIFSRSALVVISDVCDGIPRKINLVCDRLLLHGFLNCKTTIYDDDVRMVWEALVEELAESLGEAYGLSSLEKYDSDESNFSASRDVLTQSRNGKFLSEIDSELVIAIKESLFRLEQMVSELLELIKNGMSIR